MAFHVSPLLFFLSLTLTSSFSFFSSHMYIFIFIFTTYAVQHPNSSPKDPDAFLDSDWVGYTTNRTSISGSTIFMAGAPVLYKTKMQPTVA